MKNLKFLFVIVLGISLLSFGCKSEIPGEDPVIPVVVDEENLADIFNKKVKGLPYPAQDSEISTPELISEETTSQSGLSCEVKTYRWAPGYAEPILMDPTTDVIFPGSVLRGSSITDGSYAIIAAERNPLTISTSLENLDGSPAVTVENPTLSAVRVAINDLLSTEVTGDVPARMVYLDQEIHSREHLKLALGGNYDGLFADVEAQFDFESQSQMSRYIVRFTQVYYSLDVDHPSSPAAWFKSYPGDIGSSTPVYVASVKYGRMALLTFESSAELSKLKAAVKASFNALLASGSLAVSTEHQQVLNQTTFKALVIGGGSQQGADLLQGMGAFENWVSTGAVYNQNSSAAPLAYTLRFLKDNSVAKVIMSGNYQVRECEVLPVTQNITISPGSFNYLFDEICPDHIGGDREFGGHGPVETASAKLYTQNSNKELWIEVNFHVKETRSDWTEGSAKENRRIYTAPNGFQISAIRSDTQSNASGTDTDHSINRYDLPSGELVNMFDIMGDTSGDDLPNGSTTQCKGNYSYMKVLFNPIDFTIKGN